MRRLERFSHYTFQDWPDEALLEIAQTFVRPVLSRLELNMLGSPSLVLELKDESVPDALRLTFEGRIYALEIYDEFYSQPYGKNYWKKPHARQHTFHQIVGQPDAWVQELLADNPDQAVFPPHGPAVGVAVVTFAGNPTTQELTEARQQALELGLKLEREQWGRQAYYHLFIASNSVMVEILCAADVLSGNLCEWG